jgi:CxxC motif-containing protein (DUF1111 family)
MSSGPGLLDRVRRGGGLVAAGWLLVACASDAPPGGVAPGTTGDAAPPPVMAPRTKVVAADLADQPLAGLGGAALQRFQAGDRLFGTPLRLPDGLGPLYIRTSCAACHVAGGRGPGAVQKFQVVDVVTGLPVRDAPELSLGVTERPYAVAGATLPLVAPMALPGHALVRSRRVGPAVMGRGYIEAILDSEIQARAAEQAARPDAIHGRVNRVTYHSQPVAGVAVSHAFGDGDLIGRFGLKARVATLDDFTADAFQGDMGLTSPMRPDELANPEGLHDDLKPGVDVTADVVTTVAAYVRTIEIPTRSPPSGAGSTAFHATLCSVCHVPAMHTRADFPVAALADVDAPVFSDLLLHDMGETLADRLTDEQAGPRDWRTAPLIALRFQRAFLHDGRAPTIEQAILQHAGPGSEANDSVARFMALSPEDRAALLSFVEGL